MNIIYVANIKKRNLLVSGQVPFNRKGSLLTIIQIIIYEIKQLFKSLIFKTTKMETKKKSEKRIYQAPVIKKIVLDNEISLILESNAPEGPNERSYAPEYLKNDPFKTNVG